MAQKINATVVRIVERPDERILVPVHFSYEEGLADLLGEGDPVAWAMVLGYTELLVEEALWRDDVQGSQ